MLRVCIVLLCCCVVVCRRVREFDSVCVFVFYVGVYDYMCKCVCVVGF